MNWHLKPKVPEEFLRQFPEYSPLVLQLLYGRGIKTQEQIDEFFNSDYEQDLHDPFLFKGMKKAVSRILRAIKKQEKIVVYGDYDTDGVSSSVILMTTLKKLGAKNLSIYIPDRSKEGHGLHSKAIKDLTKQGVQLIITLDCGITNIKEVKLANSLGIEVIIADHHRCLKLLPRAKVIINPFQPGDKYPFKDLAGAGVAFKLAQALLKGIRIPEGFEKWFLDLVALATIADVMPLIGENRTLVKYGLGVLAQTKRIGLQELMRVARLSPAVVQRSTNGEPPSTNLDTFTLGFILAPRLNVAYRLDHANTAYQLLMTESKKEAKEIVAHLDNLNRQRQQLTDKIVKEVEKRLNNYSKIDKVIFEGDANWPTGIVGLVASKISEKYHRPSLIFNLTNEKSHGSARSVPGFSVVGAISKCADLLESFGGHPGAAGFTILKENLDSFKKQILAIAKPQLKDKDLIPSIEIDVHLLPEEISFKNYNQIQSFAPFGSANPEPKFLVRGLEISDLKVVGNNGKHLKMELVAVFHQSKLIKRIKAIGFGLGERINGFKVDDRVDVVFKFIVDEWNGRRDLQMKIVDLKLAS